MINDVFLVALMRKTGTDESHMEIDFGLVYKDDARLLAVGQGINSRAPNTVDWMVFGPWGNFPKVTFIMV